MRKGKSELTGRSKVNGELGLLVLCIHWQRTYATR